MWLDKHHRRDRRDRGVLISFGIVCLGVLCVLGGEPLRAHDIGASESRLDVEPHTVRVALFINALEFKYVDQDYSGTISVNEIDDAIPAIFGATKAVFSLRGVSEPSSVTLDRSQLLGDGTLRMDITYTFSEPVRELTLTSHLDQLGRADHKHATAIYMNGRRYDAVLDSQRPTTHVKSGFSWRNAFGVSAFAVLMLAATVVVRRLFRAAQP
jgi:hypothetical protein